MGRPLEVVDATGIIHSPERAEAFVDAFELSLHWHVAAKRIFLGSDFNLTASTAITV